MSAHFNAHGGARRNATNADGLARYSADPAPRDKQRRAISPRVEDLEAATLLRQGRVKQVEPHRCRFHSGPPSGPCWSCGQPWEAYAGTKRR